MLYKLFLSKHFPEMFSQSKDQIVSNELTELIENDPDTDIEQILLHEDFLSTIKFESDILYRRILKKDTEDKQWLYKIVNYALFDAKPPKKYKQLNRINQINKNSSNFLEQCGKKFIDFFTVNQKDKNVIKYSKLQEYLQDTINNFISDDNQCNQDPLYAGNFQRFIENFLNQEAIDAEETIDLLFPFLVNNFRILSYQQLTIRLISDYDERIDSAIIYKILTSLLNISVNAVKYIRSHKNQGKSFIKSNTKFSIDSQPLNCNKEPIPLIGLSICTDKFSDDLNNEDKDPEIPFKYLQIVKVKYENFEDAEIEAYLILMSIRKVITETNDIIRYFRGYDRNEYPLIQALLFCGTRSPSTSLISMEAFKILDVVFNGSIKMDIEPWHSAEEEKRKFDFYNEYADDMIFDPNCLTYKMIHALPVFWNHRYNEDEYELSQEELTEINVSDYYDDGKKHKRIRQKGETALEIFQPCMFCEPLLSSQLIYNCWCIFDRLFRISRKMYDIKQLVYFKTDFFVELDGIILDFYQHHFNFGTKFPDTTFPSLISKNIITPLLPDSKYYVEKVKNKIRAPMNGFLIELMLKMSSYNINQFFRVVISGISQMGRAKCFSNSGNCTIIYNKKFFIDFLSEKVMYNKYENSEFYFEKDDDDDIEIYDHNSKKKRIIVDEILEQNDKKTPKQMKKSVRNFKPTIKRVSPKNHSEPDKSSENSDSKSEKDFSRLEEENSRLRDELEGKNKKISNFEEILSLTSLRPNKDTKSDDNYYIDSEEELNFHTNPVKIDEGATSITYKIIDKRTKTPFCKKVLKFRKGQTTIKDAQNAIKEFEILHKISHPCICKAFGINMQEKVDISKEEEEDYNNNDDDDDDEDDENIEGKEITTIALFLEFIDYNLSDFLKMKISNTTKVRIVIDIVHAMKFIHAKGLIHRDLKIENIMLNSFFETKVVDFGLASINEFVIDGFSQLNESLTKGVGTIAYMSPEMANEEHYDNKTDVYSFGVLLHAIFTGKPLKQTIKDKVNGVAIKLPRPSASISKFCIKLIEQCMAHSASNRPSFEEILNQIRENSYELAPGVDPLILSKRDKELDFIENYK